MEQMNRRSWKSPALVAVAVIAAFSLSGCVLVVADEHDDDVRWRDRERRVEVREDTAVHSVVQRDVRLRDRGLAGDLERAFGEDALLAGSSITVVERDGAVTLHGRVDDLAAFDRAVEISTGREGVRKVVSKLIVEIPVGG